LLWRWGRLVTWLIQRAGCTSSRGLADCTRDSIHIRWKQGCLGEAIWFLASLVNLCLFVFSLMRLRKWDVWLPFVNFAGDLWFGTVLTATMGSYYFEYDTIVCRFFLSSCAILASENFTSSPRGCPWVQWPVCFLIRV
jgi:hypothetical protein